MAESFPEQRAKHFYIFNWVSDIFTFVIIEEMDSGQSGRKSGFCFFSSKYKIKYRVAKKRIQILP